MAETTRSFIAIALTEQLHKELATLQQRLKVSNADVKWVEPNNIHLTLKFLGNITDEQIEAVKDILKNSCAKFKPYSMHLKGMGAFPSLSSPRVIWVGMDEGSVQAQQIYDAIEESLSKNGFRKEERKFSAHLTLGRVRSSKNKQRLIEAIEKEKCFSSSEKLEILEIVLFKSTLTPSGSTYEPLLKANLAKT